MSAQRRSPDNPPPPGVHLTTTGAEFCVFAGHATSVDLVLVDVDGAHREVPLRAHAHGMWWGHVDGVRPGTRYGYRFDGPWDPGAGHRHNRAKVLLDPYARAIDGVLDDHPVVYGHPRDPQGPPERRDPTLRDAGDSAGHVPLGVVVDDGFAWADDAPPGVPWTRTVLYEAHVAGLTRRHPQVPEHLRGTYAGLAHPAVTEHLRALGVTTLELLPVHAFASEPALVRRGLTNHWGYNTLGFFAPHAAYAATDDPQAVGDEFRAMVRDLHRAGLEVVLDVVYNHTCEQGGQDGATVSWRGLDNASYYRLDGRGQDVDVTGCGNTLDLRHPVVCRMVLDSLRHWVQSYHVDGFRFDLAPALARGRDDAYDPDHPFLVALRTDPVLSQVKLIAEPWDLGSHGWRTGQFPPPFAEWNDRFRDSTRTFWLQDVARRTLNGGHPATHGVRDLGARLTGSADLFGRWGRGPIASVNYVTAHDGFTLHDLTAYDRKHNEANGEENRDGTDDNRSWNHGVEGPTGDADVEIAAARRRSARSMLATLLLSAGVPMLTAGDETGRTQGGNNNAYCQDTEVSWVDWSWVEALHARGGGEPPAPALDLLETTRFLLAQRVRHPALSPRTFPTPDGAGGTPRFRWFDESGEPMRDVDWHDGARGVLVLVADDAAAPAAAPVVLVLNGTPHDVPVTLPDALAGHGRPALLWCSDQERPGEPVALRSAALTVAASTFSLLGSPL